MGVYVPTQSLADQRLHHNEGNNAVCIKVNTHWHNSMKMFPNSPYLEFFPAFCHPPPVLSSTLAAAVDLLN